MVGAVAPPLAMTVATLPRLGSRVRIPSPAPNRLQRQASKWMVQRLSAMFIAESVLRRGRNPGAGEGPLSGRVACLFRSRSHQKAAFASVISLRCALLTRWRPNEGRNPCSAATARPELARPEAAIWKPQSCWAGARCLTGKGPWHAPRRMLFTFSQLLDADASQLAPCANNFRNARGSTHAG